LTEFLIHDYRSGLGRLTEFDGVSIHDYRAGGWDGFLSLTSDQGGGGRS
jgi:hypothetical protein